MSIWLICLLLIILYEGEFAINFLLTHLALSWRRSLSYRNHSIDLQSKSMEWFLYDSDLPHERVTVLISSGYEILLLYSRRLGGKTIIDFQHFVIWFSTCLACLRAYVPTCFVCLCAHVSTCLACLRAHVSTCLACSCAHVPTCFKCLHVSCVNMSCVLMYSRVNVVCDLTCLRANMPWVSYLTGLEWPHDHLPTCFTSSVSSFWAAFFSFTAIVVEVVHTVGKM